MECDMNLGCKHQRYERDLEKTCPREIFDYMYINYAVMEKWRNHPVMEIKRLLD